MASGRRGKGGDRAVDREKRVVRAVRVVQRGSTRAERARIAASADSSEWSLVGIGEPDRRRLASSSPTQERKVEREAAKACDVLEGSS